MEAWGLCTLRSAVPTGPLCTRGLSQKPLCPIPADFYPLCSFHYFAWGLGTFWIPPGPSTPQPYFYTWLLDDFLCHRLCLSYQVTRPQ